MEITDPKMKEAVDDWDLGDEIKEDYPQQDQKVEGKEPEPVKVETSPAADAGAQIQQPDQGQQPQHEPAGGNAPA